MSIKNVKEKSLDFKLTDPAFTQGETYQTLKKLLPKKIKKQITFDLIGVNPQITNAIRRTVLDELPVKTLYVKHENIETNDPYILFDIIQNRLSLIPIEQFIDDQKTAEHIDFSLEIINQTAHIIMVKSGDLKSSLSLKDNTNLPFAGTYRISELQPGKYLRIKNIVLKSGYGYKNAKYSLCGGFKVKPLDFIEIAVVNQYGHIVNQMISAEQLAKYKLVSSKSIKKQKILIIPYKEYQELMSEETIKRTKQYNTILELSSLKKHKIKDFELASSLKDTPKDFRVTILTKGNIEPSKLLKLCFQNLIDRLRNILESITFENSEFQEKQNNQNVKIISNVDQTEYIIKDETHTIGGIITRTISELDPNISFVSYKIIHPLERKLNITIKHPEPNKIMSDALNKCINQFLIFQRSL